MLGEDDEVVGVGKRVRRAAGVDLPQRSEHAPHADQLASTARQLEKRLVEVRIVLVLPSQVGRVAPRVFAPEVRLEPNDLRIQVGAVGDEFVIHVTARDAR